MNIQEQMDEDMQHDAEMDGENNLKRRKKRCNYECHRGSPCDRCEENNSELYTDALGHCFSDADPGL
jgi:hypothetical protein